MSCTLSSCGRAAFTTVIWGWENSCSGSFTWGSGTAVVSSTAILRTLCLLDAGLLDRLKSAVAPDKEMDQAKQVCVCVFNQIGCWRWWWFGFSGALLQQF